MEPGSNWSGHHTFTASTLHRPQTLEDLQDVVAAAPKIRALGTRHSFHDIADSAQLVTLADMEPGIRIDAETETVTLSGGVSYGVLGSELESHGWALRNLASLPHISVAGAVSTGTHGSGDHNGTLSRAVSGIVLVTASGDLKSITPSDPEFDGSIVSLGALGVIHRITLDIEPSYQVRQDVYEGLTWTRLLDNFDAIMGRAYSVSVFTDWAGESVGRVWMKSRMDAAKPPQDLYGASPAVGGKHPLADQPDTNATIQRGIPGPWIDRIPHFKLGFTPSNGNELQTEYIVPRIHALDAVQAVRALHDRITPHLHVSELRSMAGDSLWLSGAYETDALAIHFTWKNEPADVLPLLAVIEDALAPFDARPHWGKLFHSVNRELYPKLPEFVALAEDLDPEGKFRNDYLEKNVF